MARLFAVQTDVRRGQVLSCPPALPLVGSTEQARKAMQEQGEPAWRLLCIPRAAQMRNGMEEMDGGWNGNGRGVCRCRVDSGRGGYFGAPVVARERDGSEPQQI